MAGTLVVSLDFELFWGMLDVCPLEAYQDNVLGGKAAIPRLLELFEKYGIHATWATVGFLFAENYQELKNYFPDKDCQPTYQDMRVSAYPEFEKIGTNEEEAPCFYAPGLLRQIAAAPNQEIGSHTFSHYYCREKGQTVEQFAADMAAAKKIAADHGYDVKSVVMPRNECEPEYTQVLTDLGFTAYRGEENDWIHEKVKIWPLLRLLRLIDSYIPLTGLGGNVPKYENGIWNLTGSQAFRAIRPSLRFLEWLKVWRIKSQMRHAAKKGILFHLWWHPHNLGLRTDAHLRQLEDIFQYYQTLQKQYGMQSLTMGEAAEALNKT